MKFIAKLHGIAKLKKWRLLKSGGKQSLHIFGIGHVYIWGGLENIAEIFKDIRGYLTNNGASYAIPPKSNTLYAIFMSGKGGMPQLLPFVGAYFSGYSLHLFGYIQLIYMAYC